MTDPKALTEQERASLAFAAMGHQDKYIGYLLGLAASTVSGHLRSAERKLGLASRAELIQRFAPLVRVGTGQGGPTRANPEGIHS